MRYVSKREKNITWCNEPPW